MVAPLIPLVLLAAGGAIVLKARKKARAASPIWNVENAYWAKLLPAGTRGIDMTPYWASDFDGFFDAAATVRKGDLIRVGIVEGEDRNYGYEDYTPRGKDIWPWVEPWNTKEAWYIVTHSPSDKPLLKNGRWVILEALLFNGRAPKKWSIVERKNAKDIKPPRHASFATRYQADPEGRFDYLPFEEDSWSRSGQLMLPEIAEIVRDKRTIYKTVR